MAYFFNSSWDLYADSQYTSGAPLALAAGTPTVITNDGLGSLTNTSQQISGITPLWDTATNTARHQFLGQVVQYRLFFIVKPTGVDKSAIVRVKEKGGSINFIEDRIRLAKGAGVAHAITRSWPIYADAGTIANGLEFSIECTDTADFYSTTLLSINTHLPLYEV